jgi:hypothetical protein
MSQEKLKKKVVIISKGEPCKEDINTVADFNLHKNVGNKTSFDFNTRPVALPEKGSTKNSKEIQPNYFKFFQENCQKLGALLLYLFDIYKQQLLIASAVLLCAFALVQLIPNLQKIQKNNVLEKVNPPVTTTKNTKKDLLNKYAQQAVGSFNYVTPIKSLQNSVFPFSNWAASFQSLESLPADGTESLVSLPAWLMNAPEKARCAGGQCLPSNVILSDDICLETKFSSSPQDTEVSRLAGYFGSPAKKGVKVLSFDKYTAKKHNLIKDGIRKGISWRLITCPNTI